MSDYLKVTFVSQWFPPEPASIPEGIAAALHSRGLTVTTLTGIPNYPSGVVADGYNAFRTYNGNSSVGAVRRTPLFPSHDRSAVGRIVNYLSWALSSLVLGGRSFQGADAVVVYSSPVTAGLAAHLRRRRIPMILVVQDVWPDSVFASGFLGHAVMRKWIEPIVRWLSDRHYRAADRIAVIAPGMKELLVARGVDPGRVELVYNWVDDATFAPRASSGALRRSLDIDAGDFVLMYAGNHGAAQKLETAVLAAREVGDRAHLVCVGDGVEKARLQALAGDAANVHFVDAVPAGQIAALMSEADAQLVPLADHPLFYVTMPSKVQAVLAAGSVVLAAAPGDAARVVEASGAGISCSPASVSDLAKSWMRLMALSEGERKMMAANGRAYYEAEMSERVGGERLAALVRAAIEERAGG